MNGKREKRTVNVKSEHETRWPLSASVGFHVCPGCVHSRVNSRVAKCASDGVGGGRGFHATQLWRIPVSGEDKEKSRTEIVGRQ